MIEQIVTPVTHDLGAFKVRRALPARERTMVGPFVFVDQFGPAQMMPGDGMDVRPHPHINLATVTYLFDGAIQHKDSLGSDARIEPGAINLMTAGKGIVHSERSPPDMRTRGYATAALLLILVLVLFVGARLLGGQQAGLLTNGQLRRRANQSVRDLPRIESNHAYITAQLKTQRRAVA